MSNTQLFFCLRENTPAISPDPFQPGPEYEAELWRPKWPALRPPRLPAIPFAVWGLFHYARCFANRDYAILLIACRGELVHRSCVFPSYFRFPFMARNDLQIGDTWTSEAHRGKGLAAFAMTSVVRTLRQPARDFWYLCDEENVPSAKVAIKAGFNLTGKGIRGKRLGLRVLGTFQITQPLN